MADRVLVTGATGFVGSHVAQVLLEAGYEVRCCARATSDLRWISGLDTERVPLDVRGKPEDISRAVENVDIVVHAAGITRARRPEDYYLVNAEGTRRIATAALRAGVRRFVLISSLAARGPDGPATADDEQQDEQDRHERGARTRGPRGGLQAGRELLVLDLASLEHADLALEVL